MGKIVYCDTKSDEINEVHLDNYEVNHFPLILGEKPIGPYGLDYDSNFIVTANYYSNSITFFDLIQHHEIYNLCVGSRPSDVAIYEDKVYVICSESNSLNIIDSNSKNCILTIPLGDYPNSIEIDKERGLAYIVNFLGNSLFIIDCNNNTVIKRLNNLNYPTKAILSQDKNKIFISESYCDCEKAGSITVISSENYELLYRIKVGIMPVDMYQEDNMIYVANLGDGSISIVDIEGSAKIINFKIGGMPNRILKHNKNIFVSDCLYGELYLIELDKLMIKKIASGREPNAMKII